MDGTPFFFRENTMTSTMFCYTKLPRYKVAITRTFKEGFSLLDYLTLIMNALYTFFVTS